MAKYYFEKWVCKSNLDAFEWMSLDEDPRGGYEILPDGTVKEGEIGYRHHARDVLYIKTYDITSYEAGAATILRYVQSSNGKSRSTKLYYTKAQVQASAVKAKHVETVIANDGEYPDDGAQGYAWYVKKELVPTAKYVFNVCNISWDLDLMPTGDTEYTYPRTDAFRIDPVTLQLTRASEADLKVGDLTIYGKSMIANESYDLFNRGFAVYVDTVTGVTSTHYTFKGGQKVHKKHLELRRKAGSVIESEVVPATEYPMNGVFTHPTHGSVWVVRGKKAFPELEIAGTARVIDYMEYLASDGTVREIEKLEYLDYNGNLREIV